MNPEFLRNVWLELTARRAVFMIVVLALVFFAAALAGGSNYSPANVAELLFYFIVVFWGSRNAALSVVGEIRDRTWDLQRLSSLGAGTMAWGKLFGSTIYNWFGGAICLTVLLASEVVHQGPVTALIDLVYYIGIGVISQAAALLASLIAARRRNAHFRYGAFAYQLAGVLAALFVFWIWSAADPAGSILIHKKPTEFIVWWQSSFDSRPFLLLSLASFAAWTLVACYRQMRIELKMRNGPSVWLAFLLFMGVYAAGFDAWQSSGPETAAWDSVARRLALATSTFGILTYVMVLLEPKERVLYRWMGAQIAAGHVDKALLRFQAWMMSYFAAIAVAAALVVRLVQLEGRFGPDTAAIVSATGFLTRDVALFVLFQSLPGRRRGDFAAVVALFALYALIPAILHGLDLTRALPFFYPEPGDPLWLSPVVAWGEAIVLMTLTFIRLTTGEKAVVRPAPA
jgi:hypothetical protein